MIAAVYGLINLFYVVLQARFVFGGDSAEYSTVAKTWGIAHPPGYPLYSLLSNIINRIIPFETTTWKVGLLSSIPTIITSYLIYKIIIHIRVNKNIALLTSLLYLFLFPIWQYGLIPEVFALHTLLVTLITYLLLLYIKKQNTIFLLLISFLIGLCVSNHHIFVLFVPGWLFLLKDKLKKIYSNKKLCLQMLFLLCIGTGFYLYTVIVSSTNTILDWENAKTIQGLFSLITRSSYGSFKAYSGSGANIRNQLSDMISGLVFILLDFKPLGIIFIVIGLTTAYKYGKQFSVFLFTTLLLHFIFLFYTNFVLTSTISSGMFERFLIPIYIVLIFFLGIGVDYFYKRYYLAIVTIIKNTFLKIFVKTCFFLFLTLFILIVGIQNYKTMSQVRNITIFEQFGIDILNTVPQGGILTTQGDTSTFTSMYQLYGLKKRKDIVFFQLGLMGKANYIEMIKKRTPSLIISHPVKENGDFERFVSINGKRGYYAEREMSVGSWRPYGLLWKYYPDVLSAASDSANLLADNKKLWEQYKIPILSAEQKNIFHLNSIGEYYLNSYQNYAKLLVFMNKYDEAEIVLKNIAEHYKRNDTQSEVAYMNILVLEKKCEDASQIAKKVDITNTLKKYPGFIRPVLTYLQVCDPQNNSISQYKKMFLEYEKGSKTRLDSF